jgi:hypothetical protein
MSVNGLQYRTALATRSTDNYGQKLKCSTKKNALSHLYYTTVLSSACRHTNICKRKKCILVYFAVLVSLRWPDDIVAVLCEKGGSGERHIVT